MKAGFVARRRALAGLSGVLGAQVFSGVATAQSWPSRTVRVVVPFPAGGSTDLLARLVAKHLADVTGQAVVVENRAGANGNLGAASVASAPADGYTLLFTTTGPLVFNRYIYRSTPFDPSRDFTPIIKVAEIPLLLAAHPSVPVRTLAELLDYARAHPARLSYSTAGNGSMGHLTAELLQKRAGVQLTHVPYKGSAPALNDLLAGTVQLSFDLAPTYAQHVHEGKVRALAVTTPARSNLMPEVPTLAEQGVAEFQATGWNALVGPAGLPAEVIQRVNAAVNTWVSSETGREAVRKLGMQAAGGTPQQLAEFIAREDRTWKPIAEAVTVQ